MIATASARTVTSADGTPIAYRSVGTGPGLVVTSGALLAGKDYEPLASMLADRFTVHTMDRRGRGGSGPQGDGYGLDTEIDDLHAVLGATGSRFVFGHSFGGLVALQAALRSTGAIDRVAVFEPAVSVDGSMPSDFLPDFVAAVTAGRSARAMALMIRGLRLNMPTSGWPQPLAVAASAVMVHTIGRDLAAALPTFPAEARAGLGCDGPATAYAAMPVPALMMIGEHGPDHIRTASAAIAAATPTARLVDLPGLGHGAPQQTPQTLATELRTFLG
jgi:pimeloyl-ACP methyl ester carboxylesterase